MASQQFPNLNHPGRNLSETYTLSQVMKNEMIKDYHKDELHKRRRAALSLNKMSLVGSTTNCERWIDERCGVLPAQLCPQNVRDEIDQKLDQREGRGPYVVNGLPISKTINGCWIKDPCACRSDVIFYNGQAYDQKPFIKARLVTRPGNVMYLEGKLTPPFNPGKSPCIYGPYTKKDRMPRTMCYNRNQFGQALSQCCNTSKSGASISPYGQLESSELAYTDAGLPFGETIGYFRFKPEKICHCGEGAVTKLTDCCNCEQGLYNPALYTQDECPTKTICC